MPLTPNLSLNRPVHGSYINVWEGPVNDNWDIIDGLFSATGPPGHTHTGVAGFGPQLDHVNLLNKGTKTHAELDTAFGKSLVSATDTTEDFLEPKIVAGTNVVITKLNSPGNEQLEINVASIAATLGDVADPSGEYGWKHFVPTGAPVAYTDNFTYPNGFTLRQADYTVDRSTPSGLGLPDFFATGYSAAIYVDPLQGDNPIGKYASTVTCQIPHGPAQRVTASITDIDYSNLEVGDFVAFTMSLFSTHRVGAQLPQKHGVLLEIHLTKLSTGPDVFQLSHRLLVLPDASTQVVIWSHTHTNPDHMMGAWELSMDANGHLYHYWRRQLAHSTQSSPPNIPGPVSAYFSTLMASLLADSDEKYGAMGFGFHYGISPTSKFNFEFRWLTATANSDIYDETPACPGTADPYGLVDTFDLPEDFFFATTAAPGIECCPAPNAREVGDVLETDVNGNPTVWVTACCERPNDTVASGVSPGYVTNISSNCFPCEQPAVSAEGLMIFDLTGDWPEEGPAEGTTGKVVIHGLENLPPVVDLETTNPYFTIIDGVWLDYGELELKYEVLPGGGGTDIDLTITSAVDAARTLNIPILATIQAVPPQILSATWIDSWTYILTSPTAGYRFDVELTGVGLTGATLFSPTSGVTIHSFTVVSPTSITADIEFDFLSLRGAPFILSVDPSGSGPLDVTYTAEYPLPIVWNVDMTPTPDAPNIGNGRGVIIYGNFFAAVSSLTIAPVDPLQVANFVVGAVTPTTIALTFDIIGTGVDPLLKVSITDNDSSLVIEVPICVVNDVVPLAPPASVSTTPSTIYTAGREPSASGYPVNTLDILVPSGMNEACWIYLVGPVVGEPYGTPGNSSTVSRSPIGGVGQFYNDCADVMVADIAVNKTGVGGQVMLGAIPMSTPPALVISGTPTPSTPLVPGATGTIDFLFTAGNIYLTDIVSISESTVSLTNWTEIPGGLRFDFAIDADAPEGAVVDVYFSNDECAPTPVNHPITLGFNAPVITGVTGVLYEDEQNVVYTITGANFSPTGALTTIIIGGNGIYVSHLDINSTTIEVTVDNGAPGGITFQVQNAVDLQLSNVFGLTLLTEEPPAIDHVDMDPSTTGSSSTLRIYGDFLLPPGAVLAFTGFTAIGAPTHHTKTYIEQDGTITAPAAGDVDLDITSTSHSYLGNFLAKATPVIGGAVVITSIDYQFPVDNQSGFVLTIFGENLDLTDSVVVAPTDPTRLGLAYQPVGPTPAVTVAIGVKTFDHLQLLVSIEPGVAYNAFDFLLYDVGVVLIATVPSAITVQSSPDAPDISPGERLLLDGAIPSAVSTPWSVAINVPSYMFGDVVVAGGGFTLVGTPTYVAGQWLVDGLNSAVPGENWELRIDRPALSPERSIYRCVGGVTT